jgi:hypothetical protein
MTRRNTFVTLGVALFVCLISIALPQRVGAQSPITPIHQVLNLLQSFGDVSHSWSAALPADQRFVELPGFNYEAVLDRNTGLVWQKQPQLLPRRWNPHRNLCINANIGGAKGWRLPSIPELATLVDPANSAPALPTGSPFVIDLGSPFFWSATLSASDPEVAWVVNFNTGDVVTADVTTFTLHARCVRGAMNASQY